MLSKQANNKTANLDDASDNLQLPISSEDKGNTCTSTVLDKEADATLPCTPQQEDSSFKEEYTDETAATLPCTPQQEDSSFKEEYTDETAATPPCTPQQEDSSFKEKYTNVYKAEEGMTDHNMQVNP